MPTNNVVPTLSENGWVDSSMLALSYLFGHAYASDASQTFHYNGNVTSISAIIHKHGKDLSQLRNELHNQLKSYLERYYESADLNIDIAESGSLPGTYTIYMSVVVRDKENKEYTLSRAYSIENSKIKPIIEENNYGSE